MPRANLQDLPTELIDAILTYLPTSDLLHFGQTSKRNQASAIGALNHLELAIFPKRIHCLLAFIEGGCRNDSAEDDQPIDGSEPCLLPQRRKHGNNDHRTCATSLNQFGLTTPAINSSQYTSSSSRSKSRSRTTIARSPHPRRTRQLQESSALSIRTQEINTQNQMATHILSSSSLINVQTLTLHIYNLSSPDLAKTIATSMPKLQHLNLNLLHAYINDCTLPARYWRDTPGMGEGSPAWNAFSNISINTLPTTTPILSILKSLTLRRAGITNVQLRRWIEQNPALTSISLEKVRGVDLEFCEWLAEYITRPYSNSSSPSSPVPTITIERIRLEDSANLIMKTSQDFDWLNQIVHGSTNAVEVLSLEGCANVDVSIFNSVASPPTTTILESDDQVLRAGWMSKDGKIERLISPRGVTFRKGENGAIFVSPDQVATGASEPRNEFGSSALMSRDGDVGRWKVGEMEVDPDL